MKNALANGGGADVVALAALLGGGGAGRAEYWGEAERAFDLVSESFDFGKAAKGGGRYPEPVSDERWAEFEISSDEDPAERVRKINGRIRRAREREALAHEYLLLYRLALNGEAHLYRVRERGRGHTGSCMLEKVKNSDWLMDNMNFSANWLRGIMEEMASRLNISGAAFKATPRTRSGGDANAARLATKLGRALADSPSMAAIYTRHSLLVPSEGTAITRAEWDPWMLSTIKLPDGTTASGAYGFVEMKSLSRINLRYPEGLVRPDFADAPWVAEVDLVPLHEIERRWGEDVSRRLANEGGQAEDKDEKELLLRARRLNREAVGDAGGGEKFSDGVAPWVAADPSFGGASGSGGRGGSGDGGEADADDHWVVVKRYYERRESEKLGPYIQRTLVAGEIELESLPLAPLRRGEDGRLWVKLQHDGRPKLFGMPFRACRYYEITDSMEGASLTRDLLDIIRALMAIYALLLKNGFDVSNTFLMHHQGDSLSPIYARGFTLLKYHHEAPKFEKMKGQIQELVFLGRWLEDLLQKIAMRPEVMRGESPGSEASGVLVNSLAFQSNGAVGNIRARNYEHWRQVLTMAVEQVQWHADWPTQISGAGEEDASGTEAFLGADLEGATDLRVRLVAELPDSPQAREQLAARWQQMEWIGPDAGRMLAFGASLEEIDDAGRAMEMARHYVSLILDMPEETAKAALGMMGGFAKLAGEESAKAVGGFDPAAAELAMRQARNETLKALELGVEDFMDVFWHAKATRAWLESLESLGVPAANRALVKERYMALMDHAGAIPALRGQVGAAGAASARAGVRQASALGAAPAQAGGGSGAA